MRRARPTIDRAAQRAKRQGLRDRQRVLREQLQARIRKRKGAKQEEPRRSRGWLLAILILLLLLLRECRCNEPQVEAPGVGVPVVVEPAEPAPPPEPPPPRMPRRDRPAFTGPPPAVLPWLASFRMQVAARSPRLAACFVGAAAPGAIKWTTAVDPKSGQVSDHLLEPTLQTNELTAVERACVLAVLTDPPYTLELPDDRAPPSRVSLVLEF